ncbi:MAG: apolipoprotein N-acyltransferase [Paracoccaceae bacterium]|nr:apolipoprotein N-acyltransferase [Paracoccaceae bacterium]
MTRAALILRSALAGAAAGLGHAPFGLWPVAILGFAVLTWFIVRQDRLILAAWAGGVGYFGLVLHWIVQPFLVDIETHGWMAPFALIMVAAGFALFWAAAAWLAVRIGGNRALGWALCLSVMELVRGHILTGFPWGMAAYIWADTPLRVASAWTGSYGLTALTLLAAALPLVWKRWQAGAALSAALLGGLFWAGIQSMRSTEPLDTLGTVRLVAPNIPQAEKWVPERVPGHIDLLLELTRAPSEGTARPDLVVWPEAAVVYPLDVAGGVIQAAASAADGSALILGINRREEDDWYNSMVMLGSDGAVARSYDKVHLVPFGEYIPLRLDFVRAMAAASNYGFSTGAGVTLLETPLGQALPMICYEGIFARHVFRAEGRADYLLQITNDAWFGRFSGPYQHLDQARFRAAEQGLSMVRVANSGVSAVVDPFGRIDPASEVPLGRSGFADATVEAGRMTFYARFGNWPLLLGLAAALTALWVAGRRNPVANRRRT